jgi:hypothetical protein
MRPANLIALALLTITAACSSSDNMPGTYLGSFKMAATLKSNDCGSGTGAPSTEAFDIELSLKDKTLYWRQDGDTVNADLDSNGRAVFEGTYTGEPEDARSAKCSLIRADTTSVTLDSTTSPRELSGTIQFLYSVLSGYDCTLDLTTNGGAYEQVPCMITYDFTGAKN